MVNINGEILSDSSFEIANRGFLFGDGVFETMKIVRGKILFYEDHYFRLMSAMRIVRMEIPMSFTPEFIEQQILNLAISNNISDGARVRLTVFRSGSAQYLPQSKEVSFVISAEPLVAGYSLDHTVYEVDLFKDYHIPKHLLSTVKSTNKMVNVIGSIYADENGLQNCLLLNESKNVVEALQGNLFMLMGNRLITPPITEGCLNGIMRKQILALAKKMDTLEVVEEPISPFDLQKADELFVSNVIKGIQPITKYRKKEYGSTLSTQLLTRLNAMIMLN